MCGTVPLVPGGAGPFGLALNATLQTKGQRWVFNNLGALGLTNIDRIKWVNEDIVDEFRLFENGKCLYCAAVRQAKELEVNLTVTVPSLDLDRGFMTTNDGREAVADHEWRRVLAFKLGYDFYIEPAQKRGRLVTKCGVACSEEKDKAKSKLEGYLEDLRKVSSWAWRDWVQKEQDSIEREKTYYINSNGNPLREGELADGYFMTHTVRDPGPDPENLPNCPVEPF